MTVRDLKELRDFFAEIHRLAQVIDEGNFKANAVCIKYHSNMAIRNINDMLEREGFHIGSVSEDKNQLNIDFEGAK